MAHPLRDQFRFLRELIANPRNVGAIAPSGPALARAMAAQIDLKTDGPILELGPGTGVVTAAMIARGITPDRITAVEYDSRFAQLVAARFAGVYVIHGDAFDLGKTLGDRSGGKFAAVLSSLPLINFPAAMREGLLSDILDRLVPGAPFVQFSYRLHPPVAPPDGARVTQAALVMLNLPPARVWVYRKN